MKRQPRELGQALLAATFGLVVLLGAAGLAVDMGYLRYQKRLQQSAADSAALAGAAEAAAGNPTLAATNDTKLNGFTNGFTGPDHIYHVKVTVNPAFPFGAQTGVQVQVQVTQPTFFMKIFGIASTTVTASAVAITSSAKNCVYALDGFGTAIANTGTVTATAPFPGCGIVANANLSNTNTINAASVGVHGTASGSATNPAAITGIVESGDPLFRQTPPGTGGPCHTGPNPGDNGIIVGATGAAPTKNFTLVPGKYCSGITVSNRANVTFNPGTYVVTGSTAVNGINLNGAGNITGAGVTLYIATGAGPVLINTAPGSAEHLTLSAQTTGTNAGILFYQDSGNNSAATIDGNGNSTLQGALYFPNATLNLSDTAAAAYTIAVAKKLTLSGTVNFSSDYSSLPGGSPIQNAVLVE